MSQNGNTLSHKEIRELDDLQFVISVLKDKYEKLNKKDSMFGVRLDDTIKKMEKGELFAPGAAPTEKTEEVEDVSSFVKRTAGENDEYLILMKKQGKNTRTQIEIKGDYSNPQKLVMLFYMIFARNQDLDMDEYWDTLRNEVGDLL